MRASIIIGLWATVQAVVAVAQPYQTDPRPISIIQPGTIVDAGPPEGWTHLIVKSFPRVASGDVNQIPERDMRLAGLMFTALTARVQQGSDGVWRFSEVATGAGTSINGRDVVIDSRTQKQLGANFGILERMLLKEFDAKQSQAVYKVINQNFLVVDTVGAFRAQGVNRMLPLRYAMLTDPRTGRVDTFCWLMDADSSGVSTQAMGELQWLPPSLIFVPQLHVDASQYNFLGIPSDTAFCSTNIPPGRITMKIPAEASKPLGKAVLNADDAQAMHQWLGQIVSSMRPHYEAALVQPRTEQRK
ncbi:MAG: hypothetical protein R3C05_11260 [Pirellulaceae bacterium]